MISASAARRDQRGLVEADGIIMEKNRLKLSEAVQAFLDEAGKS